MKRTLGSLAALAALALGLAVGAPDGAGAASGSITPWQSSAAIGASSRVFTSDEMTPVAGPRPSRLRKL